jgi:hypothetical protein
MWPIDLLSGIFVIGLPLIWFLTWRTGKNLNGTRLENHQLQVHRFLRQMGPVWLLMVLILGHQVLDAYPGSRENRAFWLGFFISSSLFIMAFTTANLVFQLRQMQEKRRQQSQAKMEGLVNQTDEVFDQVRSLLRLGLKIRAVQVYREQTGESLAVSKAAVDRLEDEFARPV